MYSKFGWRFEIGEYDKGTYLLGCNFNSNDEWGKEEREIYVCIYLWKWNIVFGKYHYTVDRY